MADTTAPNLSVNTDAPRAVLLGVTIDLLARSVGIGDCTCMRARVTVGQFG
jgi:hypothetical protein